MLELLLWLSFFILAFTYLGYPATLALVAPFRKRPVIRPGPFEPTVSVVVAVRNGAEHIEAKIRNCRAFEYPRDKLEVIVVDDGSDDGTAELARACAARPEADRPGEPPLRLRVVELGRPLGKAAALNRGRDEASGEILAFSDVDCQATPEALNFLTRPFVNPIVGCVAGRYVASGVRGRNAGGVGLYWRYESFLRRKESEVGGLLGASGALYALRRELYSPLRPGLINDDFTVPMMIALKGFRTLYEPRAVAMEDESRNEELEFARRVRIMAGNCQHLWVFRGLLSGSRKRWRPLVQMVCHKLLRVLSPFWLIALFGANAALVFPPPDAGAAGSTGLPWGFYAASLTLQGLFYGAAAAGFFIRGPHRVSRLLTLPYYFVMVNTAALLGVAQYFARGGNVAWRRA